MTSLWLGKSLSPGPQFVHLFSALDPEWAPHLGAGHWVLVSTVIPAHRVTVSAVWGLGFPNRAVRMVGRFQSQPPTSTVGPLAWELLGFSFCGCKTDRRTRSEWCGGTTARLSAPGFARTGPCGTLKLSLWAEPCVWTCLKPSSQAGRPGLGLRPTRWKKRLRLRGTLQPAKGRTQPQPNLLCPRPRRLATGPSALTLL